MPSPFPGMDPFLESPSAWLDFHLRFINAWCEAIADELPEAYEAGLGERVYLIEVDPESRKLVYPDVGITRADVPAGTDSKDEIATLEPVTIPLEMIEGPHESYIEILHRPDRSLVAVLELLSPANKQTPDRTEYLNKRGAILRQNVHLVELDLLLGGKRLPMKKPLPTGDYFYFEARAEERPDCRVYAWPMSRPQPRLPVPLHSGDADVMIDLAKVFQTAYDRGRFGRRLAYREPCPAPLRDDQRRWVESVIATPNGHPSSDGS